MLLMSHVDKTVMSISYYYHQVSTNRHIDQESKYHGNLRHMKELELSHSCAKRQVIAWGRFFSTVI